MSTSVNSPVARIALMVPSSNTIMETDFHRELREECSVHTARMFLVDTTREAELEMIEEHAPIAARDLGTLEPDLLIFGCTSAGALYGAKYDAEVCERLGAISRAPALGVLTAIAQQLDRIEAKRLAVITPYVDDLTDAVARAAMTDTRSVVVAAGMGISDNVKLCEPTPDDIVSFARERLAGHSFDGLLVSCTNFRALEAMPLLEAAFRVPVVTSNSAILSAIRRRLAAN
jgi:maleate isomerase